MASPRITTFSSIPFVESERDGHQNSNESPGPITRLTTIRLDAFKEGPTTYTKSKTGWTSAKDLKKFLLVGLTLFLRQPKSKKPLRETHNSRAKRNTPGPGHHSSERTSGKKSYKNNPRLKPDETPKLNREGCGNTQALAPRI